MIEIRTFYKTIIDKEELFSPSLFSKFGFSNKTLDLNNGSIFFYGYQLFIGLPAKDIYNTLPVFRLRQLKKLAAVMEK